MTRTAKTDSDRRFEERLPPECQPEKALPHQSVTDETPASRSNSGGIERMNRVEFEQGTVRIDAVIVAGGFAIEPALVQPLMHEGKITSLCERGVDRDVGTFRLSFFYGRRRLRLVVDAAGNVTERSVANIRRRGPRAALRETDH